MVELAEAVAGMAANPATRDLGRPPVIEQVLELLALLDEQLASAMAIVWFALLYCSSEPASLPKTD